MGLTDERNLGQMTLSVRTSPPKCGGLRECGGGMSSRYKSEVMMKVQAQGSADSTYEANRQNMPGKNEENDSQAGSPSGTPRQR